MTKVLSVWEIDEEGEREDSERAQLTDEESYLDGDLLAYL